MTAREINQAVSELHQTAEKLYNEVNARMHEKDFAIAREDERITWNEVCHSIRLHELKQTLDEVTRMLAFCSQIYPEKNELNG